MTTCVLVSTWHLAVPARKIWPGDSVTHMGPRPHRQSFVSVQPAQSLLGRQY